MPNVPTPGKPMRILIVDQHSMRRSQIEKNLNTLGHYRVATADSFPDMLALTHYSPDRFERFDLLIINASLISAEGIDALDFCLNNPRLRHALVYEPDRKQYSSQTFSVRPRQQVRLIRSVDFSELVDFLLLIEPSI
jgi:CheY-like chemotaxis protein